MQELLKSYEQAEVYLRRKLKETDRLLKYENRFSDSDNIRLRCIYERELYEVLCVIAEIKSYLKETSKK